MGGFDGKAEIGGWLDVYDPESDSWATIEFGADGKKGPGPRSVACLLPLKVAGKEGLVTLFGESDPSNLGHQGAGKMLEDAWWWDMKAQRWEMVEWEVDNRKRPVGRGWYASDVWRVADGADRIVVGGGLNEENERQDDVWMMEVV